MGKGNDFVMELRELVIDRHTTRHPGYRQTSGRRHRH
jgi:hypothetical protein